MPLYSFYIFNRHGDNIFSKIWEHQRRVMSEGQSGIVSGFIYALQHISNQLASNGDGKLKSVTTPSYKLHYYDTITGYRAALLTSVDLSTDRMQQVLKELFEVVFATFVTKFPSYQHAKGNTITDSFFDDALNSFLTAKELL